MILWVNRSLQLSQWHTQDHVPLLKHQPFFCIPIIMSMFSHVWLFVAPWVVARQAHCPWDSTGRNTKVGSHSLLQGIFLTQALNPGLLHYKWIFYHLSHKGTLISTINGEQWTIDTCKNSGESWNKYYGGGGAVMSDSLDAIDYNPPGSSVHGLLQARILEWVATSSSRRSSQPRDQTHIACVSHLGRCIVCHCTTWEAQVSSGSESESHSDMSDSLRPHGLQSMEFSRPEYWSG